MNSFPNPLERWNSRFAEPGYLFGEEPNNYLREAQAYLKPGRCLMVADGEGRNGVWLAQQNLRVDAFDFSDNAIRQAQALAQSRQVKVNFVCSDWQSFDWRPAHYDNVVGIFFQFAPPEERAALFAHMLSSLRPGGTLIIQDYTPRQLDFNTGGPGKLAHLYDEALMLDTFGHLDILGLRTYEANITEGTGHKGMSGLLGLTARKPR